MKSLNNKKLYILSVLSGIVLAVPFLNFDLGWLSLVCLLPFIYLLDLLGKNHAGTGRTVLHIWLSGFVMSLCCFFWVAQINTDFIAGGLGGSLLTLGALLHFSIASLACSAGFIPFGYLYKKFKLTVDSKWIYIILPAVWIVCEWVRGVVFSTALLGPNTGIGSNWELQNLGVALSVTPFGYSGRLIGMYGLGFLAVIVNIAIYKALFKRQFKPVLIVMVSAIFLSASFYFLYRVPNGERINAGTLQLGTDKKSVGNGEVITSTADLFDRQKQLDLLVLPEHSEVFSGESADETKRILEGSFRGRDPLIITSRERKEGAHKYNTLTAYNPDGEIKYQRDKQLLIPVGESVPYLYRYIYAMLGKSGEVAMLASSRETTRGTEPDRAFGAGEIKIGAAACSAVMKPSLFRTQASDGAEILTNSAALSMLDRSPTYHQQALQISRFISVTNARPLVQSTKSGNSLIMDHNGRILEKSSRSESGLLTAEIQSNSRKTPYSILGEWVLYLSAVMISLALVHRMIYSSKQAYG